MAKAWKWTSTGTQWVKSCTNKSSRSLGARTPIRAASSSQEAAAPHASDPTEHPDSREPAVESELGLDYTPLRDMLAENRVREAEDETRAKLIEMAGDGAKKRKWVYFTEVRSIPKADMRTVDRLWRHFSNGRFGYSVQRYLFVDKCKRQWTNFFRMIDWVYGENDTYRKWFPDEKSEFTYDFEQAADGHLPLTNALRGTQLLEAIFEHSAIVEGAEVVKQQRSRRRPSVSAATSYAESTADSGKRSTNIPGLGGV